MSYKIHFPTLPKAAPVTVVGCGGTGGYVAEGLARMVSSPILLVDPDRVEQHNLQRQHFYAGDVGKFKAQVMAERLSRLYGRNIAYSTYPYCGQSLGVSLGDERIESSGGIIIGCVDNSSARAAIAKSMTHTHCWIDAGNGYNSGQVLLGNALHTEELRGAFDREKLVVTKLPIPSLQLPELLIPVTKTAEPERDFAQAVAAEEQSRTINQAIAALVLQCVELMARGKLTWMAAYLDLDAGALRYIPAEPKTVARMCKLRINQLVH